ncbi:MAG: Ig-like domain-containing protein [Clostridia bacterium]|nr:Ig-like domain-containing protein [Clostridia bacterium]MDD4386217.1 Ig-like domain-containing protein [Clostridia bacterium]
MKNFFERFGWVICLILTIVLSATILSTFFNAMITIVCLLSITMILVLGIVLWMFRRYFVHLILICILIVVTTSLIYTTVIFNGYVNLAIKAVDIKENVNIGGDIIADGNVVVKEDVTVTGKTILKDVIAGKVKVKDVVTGNVNVESLTVEKDVTVKGNVTVEKDVTIKGNVNVEKDVNIKGDINVGGNINQNNNTVPNITPANTTIAVTGINLTPSTLIFNIGNKYDAIATVLPSNASNKNVNWSSNDSSVATVSSNGQIVAIAQGNTIITAKTLDGYYTKNCVVTVRANTIAVTGIAVTPETVNLNVGETSSASATVYPSNASNKNVNWSSNSSSVATVSSNGTITGVSQGTAVITVESASGEYTDTCVVTVTPNVIAVTGITVTPETMNLNVGETSSASATVYPSNASNKNVNWSSNSSSIATVSSNGTITGVSQGTAIITVESASGEYTDTCVVTVTPNFIAVTGITVTPETMNLNVGETSSASATVSPSNANNVLVNWSSNSSSIATVSSNGTITGVSQGTAVITAKSVDGEYTDTCTVTVIPVEIVVPNATAKITFGDHVDGATEIFASVVISKGGLVPTIESNLSNEVVKVNDTVYHIRVTITEGSHGVAVISVSGSDITTSEKTMSY